MKSADQFRKAFAKAPDKARDANQILLEDGEAALLQASDNAETFKPKPANLPTFPLMAFKDIRFDPRRSNYLVKNLLPRSGLAVIWGPPKCYKSFWTMDVAMHIAIGREYRGHRVQQAPIVYVILEGREALPKRKEGLARRYGVDDAPLYFVTTALDLAKQADVLAASIEAQIGDVKPGAVFIDTLNRSLVGSESKDEDMAAYLAGAQHIEQRFGCLVAIVHHCGIDANRPRGHTSLTGAVEAQLQVKKAGTLQTLVTVELAKDMPEGTEIASCLEEIKLGHDEDGDDVTTLIVLPIDPAIQAARKSQPEKKKRSKSKGRRVIQDAITETLDTLGQSITPRPGMPAVRAVKVLDLKNEFERRYAVAEADPEKAKDTKRKAFQRSLDDLPESEYATGLVNGADWLWPIKAETKNGRSDSSDSSDS